MKRRIRCWVLICFTLILLVPACYAQVISIEEFIQSAMADKQLELNYAINTEGVFYAAISTDNYIIFEEAKLYSRTSQAHGDVRISKPHKIHILSTENSMTEFNLNGENYIVQGLFTADDEDYFIYSAKMNDNFGAQLYSIDGIFIRTLNCPANVKCSPGGKYYYEERGQMGFGIYDELGNFKFNINCLGEFFSKAVSDSYLLVLDAKSLALWDINSKRIVWKSDIPNTSYKISGLSIISFSEQHDLILFNAYDGCYCFNFHGDFLWFKDIDRNYSRFQTFGISESNGEIMVLIANSAIMDLELNIFDKNGNLNKQIPLQVQNSQELLGAWDSELMVYDDYIVIPYITGHQNDRKCYSSILALSDNQLSIYNIYGFWYLLKINQNQLCFIGYESNQESIKSYGIR